MEFNEKLQDLRKKKGLTQEDLAEALFVSRTAVSKWESGRGYPNLDSLKEIAKFFSVTIDELLSSNEILTIAEEDNKQKQKYFRSIAFALLDISVVLFFFLPFFAQRESGMIREVSLLSLSATAHYLKVAYCSVTIAIIAYGLLSLILQNCQKPIWVRTQNKLSLLLNAVAMLLFVISSQPYAAIFLFVFLAIKAFMLINRQ